MKIKTLFLFLIAIIILTVTASAHRGRLDQNGGHIDNSNGTYHFHHGKPAHQHPNNTCEYNFKNPYQASSDSSASNSSSPKYTASDISAIWDEINTPTISESTKDTTATAPIINEPPAQSNNEGSAMDIVLLLLPNAIVIGLFVYTVKKRGFKKWCVWVSAILCFIFFISNSSSLYIFSNLIASAIIFMPYYLIVFWGCLAILKLYNFLKLCFNIVMIKIKRAFSGNNESKATATMPAPPAPVVDIVEAVAPPMQCEGKPIKTRHCKYCGGLLPPYSGKCFDCGKNNFRFIPPKLTTSSILAVILAIGLTLVSIASYNQSVKIAELNRVIEKNKSTILRLNADILSGESRQKAMSKRLDDTNERASKYLEKATLLLEKATLLDDYVAFGTETGREYHKYDCQYIIAGSYWLDNLYDAINNGYTPCAVCH